MTEGEASSQPVRRVGRYALYGEIASGGMATVYLGRQRGQAGFARTVAIKRLHPQHAKEPDFVAMFLDEARLAARIRHPNVVPTLDVVATDGELFLVMEYVQGESLTRLLRAARHRTEEAPRRVVAAILAEVLHGLHAAHEATSERGEPLGLVHRDVSPQNVLVGTDGVARVVDFGVAKAAGRLQSTREGQLKGKIAYMAPEQITGTATRRTDVYAASVVLWEALAGRRLFTAENDASVLHQVLHAPIAPPSQHVEGLDPAWDEVVLKGLQRDPELRFATAREMALEIEKRFPLARASEVGAWVESLAHETLAKRAAEVTRVESASDVEVVPADLESSPSEKPVESVRKLIAQEVKVSAESTASRISAVSWPLQQSAAPRRRSRATLVVVGGLGLAAAVVASWAVFGTRSTPREQELPASAPAAPSIATAPGPSIEPPAASAPTAPSAIAAPSVPPASSAPAAVSSTKVGSTPHAAPTRPPRIRIDPAPTATKATNLGGVLDTRR
jgi:serine/threonine-protein kinase